MKPGDVSVLARCDELLKEVGVEDRQLAAELMQVAVKFAADRPGRAELKMMLRAFKELRQGFRVFQPYRTRRKISIFGSARTAQDDPDYLAAREFARLAAEAGFMVITGAGPGIMQAGNEGAGEAESFGVAIRLPFEQKTNAVLEGSERVVHFRYFFSRKLLFVKETHAIALFPGGFGTHDEGFEVLTLVQTGRCDPMPIVMVERQGGEYWQEWDGFVRKELLGNGLISPDDLQLYFITQSPEEAVRHIAQFYRNYHSLRFLKDDLVLRLQHEPSRDEVEMLESEFSDILSRGGISRRRACELEPDWPLPEMPELRFSFNRRSLARLRIMIDRLNSLPGLPTSAMAGPAVGDTGTDVSDRGVATIADEESITLAGPSS